MFDFNYLPLFLSFGCPKGLTDTLYRFILLAGNKHKISVSQMFGYGDDGYNLCSIAAFLAKNNDGFVKD